MIIKKSGVTIRMGVENMRVMGRATQGVRLMNLKDHENIAAVTKVNKDDDEDEALDHVEGIVDASTDNPTENNAE
jgi:DNA gyrase subunit A